MVLCRSAGAVTLPDFRVVTLPLSMTTLTQIRRIVLIAFSSTILPPSAAQAQVSATASSVAPAPRSPAQTAVMAVVDSAMAAINVGDMAALSNLMTDSGQVYAAQDRRGVPGFSMRTAAAQRATGRRGPIVERGFSPEVRVAGTFASVWLPYDLWIDGKWSHCGVDHFTLVQVGGTWRIANLTYSIEQPPACRLHPDGIPKGFVGPVGK